MEVAFKIMDGEIWVDPEGTAWKVVDSQAGTRPEVHLERKLATDVLARDFVRTWRKIGDTHPNHTQFGVG